MYDDVGDGFENDVLLLMKVIMLIKSLFGVCGGGIMVKFLSKFNLRM